MWSLLRNGFDKLISLGTLVPYKEKLWEPENECMVKQEQVKYMYIPRKVYSCNKYTGLYAVYIILY